MPINIMGDTSKITKPGDRLIYISFNLILIVLLAIIAVSCHNILMTFKPALVNFPNGKIANAILLGIPTALSLILSLILTYRILCSLARFVVEFVNKIKSFSKQKNTEEYKNAENYLNGIFRTKLLEKYKVRKWLFIHHLQGSLSSFNEKAKADKINFKNSFLERIGYENMEDFFYEERVSQIVVFAAFHAFLILIHCFFVNNIVHESIFNSVNGINLVLLIVSILLVYLIFFVVKYNVKYYSCLKNNLIKRKYPLVNKYNYYNDSDCQWAAESEIQLLDYICKEKGIIVENPNKYHLFQVKPMALEEFKQSRYYEYFKEKRKQEDSFISEESNLNSYGDIFEDRTKVMIMSVLSLFLIVLAFITIAAPYRIFQINYNMKIQGAKEQYNKALGLYNNEVIKAKNQPDSVIVNTYRNMVDYNSIGSDWDFTNSFDNTEVPVAKDNYFALEDLDNKKIKINTTIIEDDDTYPDRSYNTFYIKFNKKDLLANDSTMSWSTRQVVKENGKRSTQHYAVWETTYKISLKPKVLPSKPKPIDKEIVDVNGSVLTDRFFSDQIHVPILETSIEDIPNFVADYFNK